MQRALNDESVAESEAAHAFRSYIDSSQLQSSDADNGRVPNEFFPTTALLQSHSGINSDASIINSTSSMTLHLQPQLLDESHPRQEAQTTDSRTHHPLIARPGAAAEFESLYASIGSLTHPDPVTNLDMGAHTYINMGTNLDMSLVEQIPSMVAVQNTVPLVDTPLEQFDSFPTASPGVLPSALLLSGFPSTAPASNAGAFIPSISWTAPLSQALLEGSPQSEIAIQEARRAVLANGGLNIVFGVNGASDIISSGQGRSSNIDIPSSSNSNMGGSSRNTHDNHRLSSSALFSALHEQNVAVPPHPSQPSPQIQALVPGPFIPVPRATTAAALMIGAAVPLPIMDRKPPALHRSKQFLSSANNVYSHASLLCTEPYLTRSKLRDLEFGNTARSVLSATLSPASQMAATCAVSPDTPADSAGVKSQTTLPISVSIYHASQNTPASTTTLSLPLQMESTIKDPEHPTLQSVTHKIPQDILVTSARTPRKKKTPISIHLRPNPPSSKPPVPSSPSTSLECALSRDASDARTGSHRSVAVKRTAEVTDLELKRARNRIAARKSRERKTSRILELEQINRGLEDEIHRLADLDRKHRAVEGARRQTGNGNSKENGRSVGIHIIRNGNGKSDKKIGE
ncbi:hypothetical protein BASA62_007795 [Batrachochytrium salamandrivorans]|nr:hypothetical protein BASA62_007795 [Batrachochytrium salamandrivorans]